MAEKKVKIIHDVISLDDIMHAWVKRYTPTKDKIIAAEWYIDTARGRVVFLLTLETNEPVLSKF